MIPLGRYLSTLRRALVPSGSITQQAVRSGIWATLINVFDRLLQLGKLVVLANILTPADFGLMGIALLTLAVFRRFSNLGLNSALIQRKETDIDRHLNTVWVMKLGRGLVIAGIAFLIAPYAARFFGEPRATDIIRVIAVSPVILGVQNPGVVYLTKDLEFHKQFAYRLSSSLTSVSVAIGFAIAYQSVWALVFGYIAGGVVTVIASYLVHQYRPRFEFELDTAKELYGYGKWLTASGIVLFLVTRGDDAFIGWFLGASALGFYQLAYRFSNAPATEVTQVISGVVFPTYSKLQSDDARLREGFFKTITLITTVAFPISVGLITVSPYFVRIFLGEQWLPIIVPMQVLAVFGATRSIGAATGPLYQAIGRPDIDTKLATAHVLVLAPLIYVATLRWDLTGAAIAIVVAHLFVTAVDTYLAMGYLDVDYLTFLNWIKYPLFASVMMGGFVYAISSQPIFSSGIPAFLLLILLGMVSYTGLILVMDHLLNYRICEVFGTLRGALS